MSRLVVAFVSGLLFALGLGVSGMTRPDKVVGFLDLFGDWDPSLAFVMGGAIGVNLLPTQWALRAQAPLFDVKFRLPTLKELDVRLLAGSAVFGIGWGVAGYCPGPGVVAAFTGNADALWFFAATLVGMAGYTLFERAPEPSGRASADASAAVAR